jgi:hypothetical protein
MSEIIVQENGVLRPMNNIEKTQFEADQEAVSRATFQAKAEAEAEAEATAAAIAHAKSLGFTDAMISVMYPNLGT